MVVVDCERREFPAADGDDHAEQRRQDAERRFLFIDNVRFLAMSSILAVHSLAMVAEVLRWGPAVRAGWVDWITDGLKFGTIDFFLISGFLLGKQFDTSRPLEYLRRRLKKVFVPWLFWFYLQVACRTAHDIYGRGLRLSLGWGTVRAVGAMVNSFALVSPFWFVPNLFIGVLVLLALRRYLLSVWLGLGLFAINLFYAVNIYGMWMPSVHMQAVLGFVFYVWLGSYVAHHYEATLRVLAGIPTAAMVVGVMVAGALSVMETGILTRLHATDSVNTLRVSNQLFSVGVALLLTRVRVRISPRFLDVRRQMFGVYLAQVLVMGLMENGLMWILPRVRYSSHLRSNAGFLTLSLAVTPVIFFLCLTLSQSLAKHRYLGWMVGDHSMHNAERRAVAMIEERASALEANAALERVAASRRGKGSEQEMGDVTLA